jgi:chromosome segregation ATPase
MRKLDATYHSLVEDIECQRKVINELNSLSKDAQRTCAELETQARDLREDFRRRLESMEDPGTLSDSIKELEDRLNFHLQRADELHLQLESARARVRGVERSDAEKWARTSC